MSTTDNALRDFLEKREPELVSRINKLRAELGPLERELAEVRRAKATLGMKHGNALVDVLVAANLPPAISAASPPGELTIIGQSFANMTIKQLLILALRDHFPQGASAIQLREFIRDAYGKDIERSSLSPQLSRLADDEIVVRPLGTLNDGLWRLSAKYLSEQRQEAFYGETALAEFKLNWPNSD